MRLSVDTRSGGSGSLARRCNGPKAIWLYLRVCNSSYAHAYKYYLFSIRIQIAYY